MAKVIVERPRRGGSIKYNRAHDKLNVRKVSAEDDDETPVGRRVSMRKDRIINKSQSKELNENLQPLYRYIDSQVGRPWNKVYSEICEHISLNNAVQKHILDHVKWFVDVNGEDSPSFGFHPGYYVDDRTGILRRCEKLSYRRLRKRKPKPITKIHLGDDCWHEKLNGVWYSIKYGIVNCSRRNFYGHLERWEERREIFRRQLSTKLLKENGLRNDL